jgi:hypothetical protein
MNALAIHTRLAEIALAARRASPRDLQQLDLALSVIELHLQAIHAELASEPATPQGFNDWDNPLPEQSS